MMVKRKSSVNAQPFYFRLSTPLNPGALAVFDLVGDMTPILPRLVRAINGGAVTSKVGGLQLVHFIDAHGSVIDTGILSVPSTTMIQLMPHGGPRVVQKMVDAFVEAGLQPFGKDEWSCDLWPEAEGIIETLMLETLAIARSRDAVDILLKQPSYWNKYQTKYDGLVVPSKKKDLLNQRTQVLRRLMTPPVVVVTGAPNVGKSTLTNALTGRLTSITLDQAGTTRDFVGSFVDLSGLTVSWFDTPGMRDTDDAIEAEAQDISQSLISKADLVIEAYSPDVGGVPLKTQNSGESRCDLRVLLKADLFSELGSYDYSGRNCDLVKVSAQCGDGLGEFVQLVRELLLPDEIYDDPGPFIFDHRLRSYISYQ